MVVEGLDDLRADGPEEGDRVLVGSTPSSSEVDAVGTSIARVGSAREVPAPFQPFHVARHGGGRCGHPPTEFPRCDARGGGKHGVDREFVACHTGRTDHCVQ